MIQRRWTFLLSAAFGVAVFQAAPNTWAVSAAETPREKLQECRKINDRDERRACFRKLRASMVGSNQQAGGQRPPPQRVGGQNAGGPQRMRPPGGGPQGRPQGGPQGRPQPGYHRAGMPPRPGARARLQRIQNMSPEERRRFEERMAHRKADRERRRQIHELVRRARIAPPGSAERQRLRVELRTKYGWDFADFRQGRAEHLVRGGEIVGIDLKPANMDVAIAMGFVPVRKKHLAAAGITLHILAVPVGWETDAALVQLREADKAGSYSVNAAYGQSAYRQRGSIQQTNGGRYYAAGAKNGQAKGDSFTVGMIDTGVEVDHEYLADTKITQENFGRGETTTARDHGTAVASLIAREGNATIKVADVFSGDMAYSDAEAIVSAMDWLAGEKVGVINMSLTGPESFLVKAVTEKLLARGHVIVAAVGNEGADGPDQYPASYNGVVGVTAIDDLGDIFMHANQGAEVDYAAQGVDVWAASLEGESQFSGTSFAAPSVAAKLALTLSGPDLTRRSAALSSLEATLLDLGAPGRDPVYGLGSLPFPDLD
jgi:hypothetical protein